MELMAIRQFAQPFAAHYHHTFVIEVVTEGVDSVWIGGLEYPIFENDILVMRPFQSHAGNQVGTQPLEYRSFYPSIGWMRDVVHHPAETLVEFREPIVRDRSLAKTLVEAHHAATNDGDLNAIDQALRQLMSQCDWHVRPCTSPTPLQQVASEMMCRCREKLSVHDWAQRLGCVPEHFVRKFAAYTGMSPHRFIMASRVEWARDAIRSGASVSEVALDSGFWDQAHFTRAFQSIVGMTPGRYSKKVNFVQAIAT